MKIIITEEQVNKLRILRRIDQDWNWINQIVEEGLDIDDPCDFKNEGEYLDRISKDSARTYLYNFMEYSEGTEIFETFVWFLSELIERRLGDAIIEYYEDKKPDCK
jgi:hypothetical protein